MYIRKCPNCKKEIIYKKKRYCDDAEKNNRKCRYCWMNSEDYRQKISKVHKGKILTDEIKEKMRKSKLGRKRMPFSEEWKLKIKNGHLGKKHSEETKKKIGIANKNCSDETRLKLRKARIKQIQKDKFDGNQISPSFNKDACKIIDEYGKNHGYNFQHAMNGGEHFIPELGYWVDGYDKNKNVVIEYYEKFHSWGKHKIKTEYRQKQIINFLKCKFVIIKETGEIIIE